MYKRTILSIVLMAIAVSFAGMPAGADNVTINTSGAMPFQYKDQSYLPLQSVTSFLGAPLRWDSAKGQGVITYNDQELVLTPDNVNALFKGKPVVLASPPVVVDGRMYVPMEAFKKFYKIPTEWDSARSEMKIKGPSGWGTAKVNSSPPWHGGPPPWAPAWGQRRHAAFGNQGQHNGQWKQKSKSQGQKSHDVPDTGKHSQGKDKGKH